MLRFAIAVLAIVAFSILDVPAAEPPELLKVPPRRVGDFRPGPGTVVVVGDDVRSPFSRIDAVVLTPDEYRKLLETIEQLKKQVHPEKPEVPSICRLSGKIEARGQQEIARLRAIFEFRTAVPRAAIMLGCRKAGAVAVEMDDRRLPALHSTEDGYSVVVEEPGAHKLMLDLELPLVARGVKGNERGFTLYLPGSPITLIDALELPAGVPTARLGRILPAAGGGVLPPWPLRSNEKTALGPVEALELFWDVPTAAKAGDPLLTADGDISVRIEENAVTTTARLSLQSRTGRVTDWRVQAPAGSEISLEGSAGELSITPAENKSTWRIRAKEPGVDSVQVSFQTRVERKNGPAPIGPYGLVGAFRQQGTISVSAPSQLRPRFAQVRPDVQRAETDRAGRSVFVYGRAEAPVAASVPWFRVDVEQLRGVVQTQTSHQVTLDDAGARLVTEIRAIPIRLEMDSIDVDIPLPLQDVQAGPPELVESIVPRRDLGPTRWQIRLAQPRRSEASVKVEGFYPAAPLAPGAREPATRELAILLPQAVDTFDRNGRIQVTVAPGFEARGAVFDGVGGRISARSQALEPAAGTTNIAAQSERSLARVDVTWGPIRADLQIQATVDLMLDETTAYVRQRLTLPPAPGARRIVLRSIPGLPPTAIRVLQGGTLTAQGGDWVLSFPASPGREQAAVLSYTCPLALKEVTPLGRKVEPGLVWPATATQCETRLRCWSRPTAAGLHPSFVEGPWEELPVEPVAEHESLPALVLHGSGIALPLTLLLSEAVGLAPSGLAAERVLIQVDVADGGRQAYEARFWLHRLSAAWVDVEFPTPLAALDLLQIKLGDKRFDQIQVIDEAGNPAAAGQGRIVRVPLAALPEGHARELSITYRRAGSGNAWPWGLVFTPPKLRGSVFLGVVRWQIHLPGEGIVLNRDAATVLEQRWGWRRFMPALLPARGRLELAHWLRAGQVTTENDADDADLATADVSAVIRAADLGPVHLVRVPRWAWLLVCSLFVLGFGLVLMSVRHVRWLFLGGLLLTPLLAGAAAVLWPQPFAAFLAAAPPGLLVLVAVTTTAWYLQRRYERRVVFMPGFSRAKPGTALPRAPESSLRRRQASTTDSPVEGAASDKVRA